eukprot:SAG31_NODE_8104_length_1522_cov_1.900914_1_plen_335_part_00
MRRTLLPWIIARVVGCIAAAGEGRASSRIVRLSNNASSSSPAAAAFHLNATRGDRLSRGDPAALEARAPPNINVSARPAHGNSRMVAEFEAMDGVLIRYPLGLPLEVIVDFSEHFNVYVLCAPALEVLIPINPNQSQFIPIHPNQSQFIPIHPNSSQFIPIHPNSSHQVEARDVMADAGVDLNRVFFLEAITDSYWTRDFGPWWTADSRDADASGIVDFMYDRPRPNDNEISLQLSNEFAVHYSASDLLLSGGNMMVDGLGHAAATDLICKLKMLLLHSDATLILVRFQMTSTAQSTLSRRSMTSLFNFGALRCGRTLIPPALTFSTLTVGQNS